MKKYLISHHLWLLPALLIVDVLFFGLTDPSKVSSLMLIAGYLLAVLTLFSFLRLLGRIASLYGIPRRMASRSAGFLTVVGALCLALSSVGQLSSRDFAVILPLVILLYLYMFYPRAR